jgi:hypothetical protein
MGILRFIFIAIVFYFFYKGVKYLVKIFTERQENPDSFVNTNYEKTKPKTKINRKDIIDADFEELNDGEKEKT